MDKKFKQQAIIRICCLVAAFVLWIYISSVNNPVRTITIKDIKVNLLNTESVANSKLILSPNQDFTVNLTIKGMTADVYAVKSDQFNVVADLSDYGIRKGDNRIFIQIKQSPENVTVIKNEGMWVTVELDNLIQKNVPVKTDITGDIKDGYFASNAYSVPSEVIVSGPEKIVNQVSYVKAKGNIENFNKDAVLILPLVAYGDSDKEINNVTIEPTVVQVTVPIKKQKVVPIKVVTTGKISDNLDLKDIIPSIKEITILGDDATLNNINSIDTEPIDLTKITKSQTLNLKFDLPEGVNILAGSLYTDCKIDVEKIITKTIVVSLKTINLDTAYTVGTLPSDISISVTGDESVIDNLLSINCTANLDLSSVIEGENSKDVIVNVPNGVELKEVTPKSVTFTISKEK